MEEAGVGCAEGALGAELALAGAACAELAPTLLLAAVLDWLPFVDEQAGSSSRLDRRAETTGFERWGSLLALVSFILRVPFLFFRRPNLSR